MTEPYRGSCLCRVATFEIEEFLPEVAHCHCSMCRKFHGAAYATIAAVARSKFRWLTGEDALKGYTAENGTIRTFCRHCGSSLAFYSPRASKDVIEIALGTLDDDLPVNPNAHIFVGSKANWTVLSNGLPYYKEGRNSVRLDTAQFDFQPLLKGELVELRPLRADDYHDLYAVASDPLIWAQHPVQDRHKEEVFKIFFHEAVASGGTLLAIDAKDNRVIGSSRFHSHNGAKNEVEIGWTFLSRSHWGGRYNGEMKKLMLNHAFKFVDNVVLLIGPDNIRSQRAVEKIGGVRAGVRPDGGGRESIVFKIAAADFADNHQG